MTNGQATTGRDEDFHGRMRLVLDGDSTARERLYLDYGQYFRRMVANRLRATQLTWATTPHDIFNSVVVRIWEGKALLTLQDEADFLKYVTRAIDHEILDLRRELTAACRDFRREESLSEEDSALVAPRSDPLRRASAREELDRVRTHFPVRERPVLEMWLAGDNWTAIGAKLGVNVSAIRRRFHRSLAQVRERLLERSRLEPD